MKISFQRLWGAISAPFFQRTRQPQVAALCYRIAGGTKQVLLITSRDTGRWIIPKGWPINGLDDPQAALQEAWEEAGVTDSAAEPEPIGTYSYDKTKRRGPPIPVEAQVYPVEVEALKDRFPEAQQRTRKWVTPKEAAALVREPELKSILRDF